MAKLELRNKAIEMREQGMSYSEIRNQLKVSKSSLSIWLKGMPLSEERLAELRNLPARIERIRETKRKKREQRQENVREEVGKEVGKLSRRELFIAGLILYWAEGTKASRDVVCITNTDPAMIKFFIEWLEMIGISKKHLKIKLHLYKDMNLKGEINFWSVQLGIPPSQFARPYIKESVSEKRRNYKGRFGHGTCNLLVHGRDIYERTMLGTDYIRSLYGGLPMQI